MDRKLILPTFETHVESYIDSEINLLLNLKKNLLTLKNKNLPHNLELKTTIFELGLDIREYNRQKDEDWRALQAQADFSQHPSLWSNTSRCFATDIIQEKNGQSLHAEINRCLAIKVNNKRIRSLINNAKKEHEQNRLKFKLDFLKRAIAYKIKKLKKILIPLNLDSKIEKKLLKELNCILHLQESQLQTRGDCVVWHKRVSDLEKTILDQCKKSDITAKKSLRITHQIEDISLLTKRFLDHYYDNPAELSLSDKLRKGTKIFSLFTGITFSITALILLFTPAAPLSPFFGFAGLVGLYPLLDTIGEVTKNIIFYHRAPTKSQIVEVAFGIFIVIILTIVLPTVAIAIPAIGSISGSLGGKICGVISKVCDGINLFGMKSLGIMTNLGRLFSETYGLIKNSFHWLTKRIHGSSSFVTKITLPHPRNIDFIGHEKEDKKILIIQEEATLSLKSEQAAEIIVASKNFIQPSLKEDSAIASRKPQMQKGILKQEPTFEANFNSDSIVLTRPFKSSPPMPIMITSSIQDTLSICTSPPASYNITAISSQNSLSSVTQARKKSVTWNPSLFTRKEDNLQKASSSKSKNFSKVSKQSKKSQERTNIHSTPLIQDNISRSSDSHNPSHALNYDQHQINFDKHIYSNSY